MMPEISKSRLYVCTSERLYVHAYNTLAYDDGHWCNRPSIILSPDENTGEQDRIEWSNIIASLSAVLRAYHACKHTYVWYVYHAIGENHTCIPVFHDLFEQYN